MTTLKHYTKTLRRFLRNNKAVSAMEYAILVGAIAVALGAALVTFGENITSAVEKIGENLKSTHSTVGNKGTN